MNLKYLFSTVYIFLFVSLFALSNAQAQRNKTIQKYDIVVAGFRIGGMTAERTTAGAEVNYEINSLVEFWFFGKVHVEFFQTADYKAGQLVEAYTHSNSNRGDFETFVK